MVDLVKIRKKAEGRRQKAEVLPAEPVAPAPSAPVPVPEPEPEPEKSQSSGKLEKFKQEAGTKRQDFVDETEDAASGGAQLELLTFVLAGEQYAVDIEHIVEIVTPR